MMTKVDFSTNMKQSSRKSMMFMREMFKDILQDEMGVFAIRNLNQGLLPLRDGLALR